jgi:hypothetical protein
MARIEQLMAEAEGNIVGETDRSIARRHHASRIPYKAIGLAGAH